MAQLTVDLSADKATLARIAQLILQFAGYEPPTVAATPAPQGPVTHPLLAPLADIEQTGTPAVPEQGPFYWWHPESESSGVANTREELNTFLSDGLVEEVTREKYEQVQAAMVFGAPAVVRKFPTQIDPVGAPPVVIPPPPPPAGIDVDLRGLPWDPRIHASTRAKTAEGNWRQKRNVDPELMTKVEAELRQTMGAPAIPDSYTSTHAAHRIAALPLTVPVPPAPVVPPSPVVPPVPFAGSAVPPAPPVSSTPPVPASAGAVPPASPGNAVTFVQFVHAVTKACTVDKTLTQPQVAAALQKFGVASLPLLSARPDLVGAVSSELGLAL